MEHQDLLDLKELLPKNNGESVVVTRYNDKFYVGNLRVSLSDSEAIDEDLMGKLLVLNKKLASLDIGCGWYFVFAAIGAWLCWRYYSTDNWVPYAIVLGIALVVYMSVDSAYSKAKKNQIMRQDALTLFRNVACQYKITENELLTRISKIEKLSHLKNAMEEYLAN